MNANTAGAAAKRLTVGAQLKRAARNARPACTCALILAGLLTTAHRADAAVLNVYWTDRDNATLSVTSVPGGVTTPLASGFSRLQDVDLDANTNTLYFSDWGPVGPPGGQGSVNRINTNGTGLATVLSTGDAVHQLALDPANQRLYFTRAVSYEDREISRVDYSGANYTVIHSGTGSGANGWFYSGLALDPANNLLYWGDPGILTPAPPADGAVNRMTTTGGSPTTLVAHLDGKGRGYALDQASQTLFYTSHDFQTPASAGAVFAYDIVNGIETQIVPTDTATGYWDIEIDPYAQRIWWTAFGAGEIRSAKFDGSDVQVELSGLTNPYGLALEFVPEPSGVILLGLGAASVLGLVGWRARRSR